MRRLLLQGGLSIGGKKIDNIDYEIEISALEGEGLLIKKGKKHYYNLRISD